MSLSRISLEQYVLSSGGPLPYMRRLREIELLTEEHERRLDALWRALADECAADELAFARRWHAVVRTWDFDEVNALVDQHNRYYPIETRLKMDVRTGDFVRINGRPYRREPLDEAWALARFPPALAFAHG